jgi:hypothetical protein
LYDPSIPLGIAAQLSGPAGTLAGEPTILVAALAGEPTILVAAQETLWSVLQRVSEVFWVPAHLWFSAPGLKK